MDNIVRGPVGTIRRAVQSRVPDVPVHAVNLIGSAQDTVLEIIVDSGCEDAVERALAPRGLKRLRRFTMVDGESKLSKTPLDENERLNRRRKLTGCFRRIQRQIPNTRHAPTQEFYRSTL